MTDACDACRKVSAPKRITIGSRPVAGGDSSNTAPSLKYCAIIGGVMKLTPGKLRGLKAVSNDRGVIAAAAMDQRG
jgi:hypothetical protein